MKILDTRQLPCCDHESFKVMPASNGTTRTCDICKRKYRIVLTPIAESVQRQIGTRVEDTVLRLSLKVVA